jgi:GTP-binding protein
MKPLHVSAATGQGVPEVLAALARKVEAMRESESPASMPRTGRGWQP